jgi:hypothetical protein
MIRSVATIVLVGILFFSISSNAFAAYGINRQINFQGKLVDDDGLTVADDTYTIVFTFYNASADGTVLWTETDSVTTVNGIFRVPLGAVEPIPTNFNFNWDGLYLGIKISTEENEMEPRIQMTAVPMAFNAQQVAGLTVQDENGNASTSGILKIPNAKTISFADAFTTSGANALTLTTTAETNATLPEGTVTLLGTTGSIAGLTGTISSSVLGNSSLYVGTTSIALNRGSAAQGLAGITGLTPADDFTLTQNSVAAFASIESGAVANTLYLKEGKVGIGMTNPGEELEVAGTIKMTGFQLGTSTTAGYVLTTDADGVGTWAAAAGSNYWTLDTANGALYPNITKTDLLIGGISTTSAKFAVLNMASGTPTASIAGNLSLSGASLAHSFNILDNGTLNFQRYPSGDAANNSSVLFLGNNGDVGIGTTAPLSKLDIAGTFFRLGETVYPTSAYPGGTNAYLVIDKSGASGEGGPDASIVFREEGKARAEIGLVEDNKIHFKTITGDYGAEVFTDRFTIETTGEVWSTGAMGVGTIPSEQFHVVKDSSAARVYAKIENTNDNGGTSVAGSGVWLSGDGTDWVMGTDAGLNNGDNFFIMDVNADAYRMFINSSGTVGIGTLDPSAAAKLDVAGNLNVQGYATMSGSLSVGYDGVLAGPGNAVFAGKVGIGTTNPSALLSVGASSQFQVDGSGNIYGAALYLGTNESANGSLTLYSSGEGETDPTIVAGATGNLTLSAATGQVIVGSGTGDIALSLTGAADILSATKVVTLEGAYSAADYTFNRTFTGGANDQGGTVLTVSDTSGGSGTINPDMLVVNSALTSGTFAGNLLRLQVGGVDKVLVDSAGKVGIGTTAPSVALHVVGNGRFTAIGSGDYSAPVNQTTDGTFTTATSDIRFKKDIITIDDALSKVLSLRGVTFNWINPENPKRMMGMIAQEVIGVVPELVFQNPTDGYYGISYGETSGLLIEAIKEQQMQITSQGELLTAQDDILQDLQVASSEDAIFDLSRDPLFQDAQDKITDLQSKLDALSQKVDQELSGLVLGVEASGSAEIQVLEAELATQSALTLSDLSSEGLATVSGSLRVKGNGLIEGVLSVIDTLIAQDLLVSGVSNFLGDVIVKGNIEFFGRPTFNKDTAGLAVIKKDADKIEITFENEYENTPIVNVSLNSNNPDISDEKILSEEYSHVVSKRTTKGFTITLSKKAQDDVEFSWIALSIKDAKRYESSN